MTTEQAAGSQMLTARQAAIRLLRWMMIGSVVLPVVLFACASWLSYRNVQQLTDDRIDRSLDILHEHALKVLQSIDRTFAEID
jgi:two-component system NtrC family sensor kinase